MNIPNSHDGHFDGLWLQPNKTVYLFLRTSEQKPYTISLQGVQGMALSDVKAGNIIFDLGFRSARQLTLSDMATLYNLDEDSEQATKLLNSTRGMELQVLELNATYGAQGLFLFENFEITQKVNGVIESLPSAQ
jgi:hypothetical protein